MLESIKYYLNKLIADGHKWQYLDINGNGQKPKLYFNAIQLGILVVSFLCLFILPKGYNKDFIGYVIAALSIFIGLFMTLIITMFDKFQKVDFKKVNLSENDKIRLVQLKNFFKQFTALTSYSIIIALLCILLLSASLLVEYFNQNIYDYSLINNVSEINIKSLKLAFGVVSLSLYRLIVLYFLLDFLLMTLFGLSSMYNYIVVEYEKERVIES